MGYGGMWKSLLWVRKVLEYCEQSVMGFSGGISEARDAEGNADSERLDQTALCVCGGEVGGWGVKTLLGLVKTSFLQRI